MKIKNNIFLTIISACLTLASCSGDTEDLVNDILDCNGMEISHKILGRLHLLI